MTSLLPSARTATSSVASTVRRGSSRVSRRSVMLSCGGALVVVLGLLISVAHARSSDARRLVLVVSHDLPAGARLSDSDLAVSRVATDGAVAVLPASQRAAMVGQFLRVRLLAGQLMASGFVQPTPLVSAGKVVVALPVTAVQLPWGLHELSKVELIVTPTAGSTGGAAVPFTTEAVVVRYPQFGKDGASTAALSVEVDPASAPPLVAAGRNVAVVLLDPAAGVSAP